LFIIFYFNLQYLLPDNISVLLTGTQCLQISSTVFDKKKSGLRQASSSLVGLQILYDRAIPCTSPAAQ